MPSSADHRSPPSGDRIVGARRLAALASQEPIEGVKVCSRATLGKELSRIHDCQFVATAVATNWFTLIPSRFARRFTSALTERGRRSG
jgi:hypothetical protein